MFLLLLCNDRDVLGPWVNPRWLNARRRPVVGVLVVLSTILTIATILPGADVTKVDDRARRRTRADPARDRRDHGASAAGTLPRRVAPHTDWERRTWTTPPLETLPSPAPSRGPAGSRSLVLRAQAADRRGPAPGQGRAARTRRLRRHSEHLDEIFTPGLDVCIRPRRRPFSFGGMSAHRDLHHRSMRGLGTRLRAAWAREELDRRLAEGADPDTDPLLQTRAARLVMPASRATLAAGLERAVAAAHDPGAAIVLRRSRAPRTRPWRASRADGAGGRTTPHARTAATGRRHGRTPADRSPRACSSPPASSAEVARAARDAVDNMRADDVPITRGTPGEGRVRTTSTSLRTTPTPPAAAAEHHFHRPKVAPLPPRAPVDSAS